MHKTIRLAEVQESEEFFTYEMYYKEEQKEDLRACRLSKIAKLGKGLRTNLTVGIVSTVACSELWELGSKVNQGSELLVAGSVVAGGVALCHIWGAFKKGLKLENMAKENFEKTLEPEYFDVRKKDKFPIPRKYESWLGVL